MSSRHNAKYAFYYLLSFAALVFMSISVGMILFQIIDKNVPDILSSYAGASNSALKFAISSLIIATPVFYIISRFIYQGLKKGELAPDAPLRRWLTYFILLVSSIIILGVMIGVINNFLSGELTWRFVFKALSIFVLASIIFSFYFLDLRRQEFNRPSIFFQIYFYLSLVIVTAVFIAAWFYVESPKVARDKLFDRAITSNMYNIESAVNDYFSRYKKLPADLAELEKEARFSPLNPSAEKISYNKLSEDSFELCANFRTDSRVDNQSTFLYAPMTSFDNHRAGYWCGIRNLTAAGFIK
ncbi:MAG: DUF5671 domain-containing protein [Patescibacteria group bacterium]